MYNDIMTLLMPENESTRLTWLHESQILDSAPEDVFDEVTRLAAELCGAPIAAITLIDTERQWFKSIVGCKQVRETPRAIAFCAHTILQPDLLIVPDARKDKRFAQNPLVLDDPSIRFYAGAPLITTQGYAIGSLCVIDQRPRELTLEQQVILRMLARQVASRFELQHQIVVQQQLMEERAKIQAALERSEARLKDAQSLTRVGSWEYDIRANRLTWSDELFFLMDIDPANGEPTLAVLMSHYHPEDVAMHLAIHKKAMMDGEAYEFDIRALRQDGSIRWMHAVGRGVKGPEGKVERLVGTLMDVHARRTSEDALRESESRMRMVLETGRLSAWRLDLAANRFIGASAQSKALLGLPSDAEFTRAEFLDAIHPDDRTGVQETLRLALKTSQFTEAEFRTIWPDGSIHWLSARGGASYDDNGRPVSVSGVMHDITDRKWIETQREQALCEAEERADRDPLTGLWNHRAFHKRLEDEASRVEREGGALTVAMIDVDRFQFFNDVYGHVIGDDVLRVVAMRLRSMCRPYDTMARFGGDEFAMLLPSSEYVSRTEIERRLQSGFHGLTYTPPNSEVPIPIELTIGVSSFSPQNSDRHEVMRLADERLRRAKTGADMETEADQVRAAMNTTLEGFSMLDALVTAVDNKDRYTRRHSEDVMTHCLTIARAMGMSEKDQQTIGVAALLHDVGKIGVPDAVLRKPGKLTEFEYEAVQRHPLMGAAIVSTVAGLEEVLDAVRHHHERWDGGGYPSGLCGAEIPLIARVMAIADAFSAMTTDRPYRAGMPAAKALAILETGAGTQWDPDGVRAFLQSFAHEYDRAA